MHGCYGRTMQSVILCLVGMRAQEYNVLCVFHCFGQRGIVRVMVEDIIMWLSSYLVGRHSSSISPQLVAPTTIFLLFKSSSIAFYRTTDPRHHLLLSDC